MIFKLIYTIFCFAILLYRSEPIALIGLTPRQLMTFVMFVACIIESRTYLQLLNKKILYVFFVFLLNFGVSSLMKGYHAEFFHDLFGYYVVSVVAWMATSVIVVKEQGVKTLILIFLFIGIFDAYVTILQFFGSHSYESFVNFMGINTDDVFSERYYDEEMYGYSLPGLFENAVDNGYFLSVNLSFSFYYFYNKKSVLFILLPLLFLFGVFCCQQRTALFSCIGISSLLFFIHFKKTTSPKTKILEFFPFIIIVVLILNLLSYSDTHEMRYAQVSLEADPRRRIYDNAIEYILSNPFFVNIYEFRDLYFKSPHNLFLNAYIYGGLISFVLCMYILFVQIKYIYYSFKMRLSKPSNVEYLIMGAALLVYTLNSLTHNDSFITGDMMCWLLWGALYSQYVVLTLEDKKGIRNRIKYD